MDHNNNLEEFNSQIQRWVTERQKEAGLNKEDINNELAEAKKEQNHDLGHESQSRFNGFSCQQIKRMVGPCLNVHEYPVQLRLLNKEQISEIPIMRQVLYLMGTLAEKELKLTHMGNLPPKLIEELYNLGTKSSFTDYYKQKNEPNVWEVQTLRYVLKERSLISTEKGRMSLTTKGRKMLKDPNQLMRSIIEFLLFVYHTGFHDRIKDYKIGNKGKLYSLWLLHHFGDTWRYEEFYEQEYFKAFPEFLKKTDIEFYIYEQYKLYSSRIFQRLFNLIGLCEINQWLDAPKHHMNVEIRKSPILDMMFSFEEPAESELGSEKD